jgi:HAMP domain-containing protein
MKYRFLVGILPVCVACALLLVVYLAAERDAAVTLTELIPLEQAAAEQNVSLAALDVESIFYAVLSLCGLLLAVRVIVSVFRALKEERMLARRRSAGVGVDMRPPVPGEAQRKAPRFVNPEIDVVAPENGANAPVAATGSPGGLRGHLAHFTHGLTGKMIFTFSGVVAAFGLVTLALLYFTLSSSMGRHVMQRARVTAVNVSDGAPAYMLKKNATGLGELLRKHVNRPGVAYILVENRAGEIFAHSFPVLPQELERSSSRGDQAPESQRTLRLGDDVVYEVSAPILEGRTGAVRVGIWREQVDAEINETVVPLIKLLAFVLCAGILAAVLLAWRINRPIFRLIATAKAISAGDLDAPPLHVEDVSEFGELSRALERMRSSVKAAMIRLNR